MPPTPQPTTPRPLIIVVWESVPTSVSGIKEIAGMEHALGEILEIDLVHDADARWHEAESLEGLLPPFQKFIAFAVAFEFHVHVQAQGRGGSGEIHLHRVIDDEIDRHERLDDFRIAA